jgi:hypothetical protein
MGNGYTKQEEKEVIVTQNAVGSNDASTGAYEHTRVNNIMLSILFAVIAIAVCCGLFKVIQKAHEKLIQKEVRREMWARVQTRLSGRKKMAPPREDEEEV